MSLSHEQRYLLEELREYLKRVEKMVSRYGIDLNDLPKGHPVPDMAQVQPAEDPDRSGHRREVFVKAFQAEKIQAWYPEEEV